MFLVINLVEIFDVYITYCVGTVLIKNEGSSATNQIPEWEPEQGSGRGSPEEHPGEPTSQGSQGSWWNFWETEELREEGLICRDTHGPREHYAKWNKPDKERQTPKDFTYLWNLKQTKEKQNRIKLIDNWWLLDGRGLRGKCGGDVEVQTANCKNSHGNVQSITGNAVIHTVLCVVPGECTRLTWGVIASQGI